MPSVLRSVVALSFVSVLAVLSAPGCSQQGEGERCDNAKNGDADCDSGLTCVKAGELLSQATDRCCPADGQETDTRCTRGVPSASGTDAGGASSVDTSGNEQGGDASGTTGGVGPVVGEAGAAGALNSAGQGGAG